MSRMRQRIAQRLKDAQNTNAMLTTFQEVTKFVFIIFFLSGLQILNLKYYYYLKIVV